MGPSSCRFADRARKRRRHLPVFPGLAFPGVAFCGCPRCPCFAYPDPLSPYPALTQQRRRPPYPVPAFLLVEHLQFGVSEVADRRAREWERLFSSGLIPDAVEGCDGGPRAFGGRYKLLKIQGITAIAVRELKR